MPAFFFFFFLFFSLFPGIPVPIMNKPSSSAPKRNPRDAEPSKGDNGVLSPQIQQQITKSVQTATQKICTSKSQVCVQGPPGNIGPQGTQGPPGPPGIKGQKGAPGEPTAPTPTSIQPFRGQAGDVISAPGIIVSPAVRTVALGQSAVFKCSPEKTLTRQCLGPKKMAPSPREDTPSSKELYILRMRQSVIMECTCVQFVLTRGPLRRL